MPQTHLTFIQTNLGDAFLLLASDIVETYKDEEKKYSKITL